MISPTPRWLAVSLLLSSLAFAQKTEAPKGWAVVQDQPLRLRATMPAAFKRTDTADATTWLGLAEDGVVYSLLTTQLKGQDSSPSQVEANLAELSAGHYAHSKCKGSLVPGTARKEVKDGVTRVGWVAQCADGKIMVAKLSHQHARFWMMSALVPKDSLLSMSGDLKRWFDSFTVEK